MERTTAKLYSRGLESASCKVTAGDSMALSIQPRDEYGNVTALDPAEKFAVHAVGAADKTFLVSRVRHLHWLTKSFCVARWCAGAGRRSW